MPFPRHQLTTTFLSRRSRSTKLPILYKPEARDSSTTTIQLLSWGSGAAGQLGGGLEELRRTPSTVSTLLLPSGAFSLCPTSGRLPSAPPPPVVGEDDNYIVSVEVGISCGLFHSGLLVDGRLWVWGKGDGGRLGFGNEVPMFVPRENTFLDCVRCVALGGLHSVAMSSFGEVFTWGYGGFGALGHRVYHRELYPRLVEGSWNGKIRHVATSGTHTAAITETGVLYTWGRDEGDGRLGLGPGRGPNEGGGFSIPSKVKALPMPVAAVSCGGFFTLVLTEDGQVWNWGANANYELGRGNKVGGWKPRPIPDLEGVHIIQIASGGYHSLALTDDGKVLSWGHGGHGQLGHGSKQNKKTPALIKALDKQHIIYIACGGSTSAAITDSGRLYMWGNAKDSQLGVPGLPEIQPSPVEVKFFMEDDGLGPLHVLSVAVGASHAMCLVSRTSC